MGIVMPLFVIMLVYMLGATVAVCYLARRRSRERQPDAVGGEERQDTDDGRYDSARGGREREPPPPATESADDGSAAGGSAPTGPEGPRKRRPVAPRIVECQYQELHGGLLSGDQVAVRDELMRHRVDELKAALRARGLSTTGLKANLANRLAGMATGPFRAKQGPKLTIDELVGLATTAAGSTS